MREEKIGFGIILRIGLSLLPILFGYGLPAVIWCSFNITMAFIVFGPVTSFVSSLCAICISMFFCGFYGEGAKIEGLFLALQAIFSAVACIYAVASRKKFFTGVWLASIGHLIPAFLSVKNAASDAGQSVAEYMTEIPMEGIKAQMELTLSDPSMQIFAGQLYRSMEIVHKAMMMIVPAMLITSSVIVGYLIMWCVAARLRHSNVKMEHSFAEIKVPRTMVVIAFAALILGLCNLGDASIVAINVFVVLISLFFFAGMSFVEYYIRLGVKSSFLRIIIHLSIIFSLSAVAGILYMLAAAVDSFFDFRKINSRRNACETEE